MDARGADVVAKKPPKRKPDEEPVEPEPEWTEKPKKPVILQVRGNPEYKATLEDLAEFDGLESVSALFDRAIRHYARYINFPKQFPKR